MSLPHNLTFRVTRQDPELIPPARHTPNELKQLSRLDEMPHLRIQVPFIQFYKKPDLLEKGNDDDPAKVIREAIAQALVYYYPLAGRLREKGSSDEKALVVDCTGEGVMFVEAYAEVSIGDFGDVVHPPFPGVDELLFYPSSGSILDSPLLHFQVTRLKCGGFILATVVNHVMVDAAGLTQFMTAVSEIAKGFQAPSVLPVWERHLLRARDPPKVIVDYNEPDNTDSSNNLTPLIKQGEEMVEQAFLFDPPAISCLRQLVGTNNNLPQFSTFELLSGTMWRARTLSLPLYPDMNVGLRYPVNIRNKVNTVIPSGYYGNLVAARDVITTSGELKTKPLKHAIELVKRNKEEVTEEYIRSEIDRMVILHGHPPPRYLGNTVFVSDTRRVGFHEIDYGWSKPVYGGPAKVNEKYMPGYLSFLVPVKNSKKEEIGILMPVSLPEPAMNLFVNQLNVMMGHVTKDRTWKKTTSTLFCWVHKNETESGMFLSSKI